MNEEKIEKAVVFAIKRLQEDYKNNLLCHEWSLQSALYMHLRNQLYDLNNGKVWCELRLKTGIIGKEKGKKIIKNKEQVAVDIGIVVIDEEKETHLKNRITQIHALIEIKYVQISENAKNQFMRKLSNKNDTRRPKIVDKLYGDIIKLNKLRWCCMNMDDENLIEKYVPSTYFITCIEDTKTYKEEFLVIKDWDFLSFQ